MEAKVNVNLSGSTATVSVPEAGKILGIGRGLAYDAARRGEIPTIRIGGRLLVPTSRLRQLLEGDAQVANGA